MYQTSVIQPNFKQIIKWAELYICSNLSIPILLHMDNKPTA